MIGPPRREVVARTAIGRVARDRSLYCMASSVSVDDVVDVYLLYCRCCLLLCCDHFECLSIRHDTLHIPMDLFCRLKHLEVMSFENRELLHLNKPLGILLCFRSELQLPSINYWESLAVETRKEKTWRRQDGEAHEAFLPM